MSALKDLLSDISGYLGEYGLEMKAIADFLGIDVGIIVTLNLSYELRRVSSYLRCSPLSITGIFPLIQLGGGRINTTGNVTHSTPNSGGMGIACTSILAFNKSGNVFHGRTLDWEMPVNMRNLTIQVRVHSKYLRVKQMKSISTNLF